jgi:hypothetical protein
MVCELRTVRQIVRQKKPRDFEELADYLGVLRLIVNEKRQANRGLYQSNDEPWPELIQALGRVQNRFAGQ